MNTHWSTSDFTKFSDSRPLEIFSQDPRALPEINGCSPTNTPPIEKQQPDSKDSSKQNTIVSHKSPTFSTPKLIGRR